MAVQLSIGARNGRLDAIEVAGGTTPWLDIRTSTQPADCATADSGTELVHMDLPSDWMAAASGGTKDLAGSWSTTADAAGDAGHFRIKDLADTNCHIQGSITATSGGGDMELDNITIASGQTVTVNTFTLTDGNA